MIKRSKVSSPISVSWYGLSWLNAGDALGEILAKVLEGQRAKRKQFESIAPQTRMLRMNCVRMCILLLKLSKQCWDVVTSYQIYKQLPTKQKEGTKPHGPKLKVPLNLNMWEPNQSCDGSFEFVCILARSTFFQSYSLTSTPALRVRDSDTQKATLRRELVDLYINRIQIIFEACTSTSPRQGFTPEHISAHLLKGSVKLKERMSPEGFCRSAKQKHIANGS